MRSDAGGDDTTDIASTHTRKSPAESSIRAGRNTAASRSSDACTPDLSGDTGAPLQKQGCSVQDFCSC